MVPRTPAELERVVETLTEIARRRSPISEDIDLMIAIECVSEVANYRALALGISKMVSERDERTTRSGRRWRRLSSYVMKILGNGRA